MPQGYFGEGVAAAYDEDSEDMFAPDVLGATVDPLAELAGEGAVLDFARWYPAGWPSRSQPRRRRVRYRAVHRDGRRVRAKAGGERVRVTIGDVATTRLARGFRLMSLAFNTIGDLTTQGEEVACFANAAAHLDPGGRFLIEVGVPDLRRLPPGKD